MRASLILRHLAFAVGYGALGVVTVALVAYVTYLRGQAELEPWHRAELASEFTADLPPGEVPDFAAYVAREDRVFRELHAEVYDRLSETHRRQVNRYHARSLADPESWPTNWNRTFEFVAANPRGGVVLLHGLSDGPYSLRALGQTLHARGFHVVGLRLPGHGTAPVGLARATTEDFVAATRLAVRHVRGRVGSDRPLHLVGYSNGGALAVDYALARCEGEDLPAVDGLVLISPAIGVSPAAALAAWQRRLSCLPGLEKAVWESIGAEYDPYKYNSFAVNAGDQVYRLTRRIEERIARLAPRGSGVTNFPPVLAFQSVVDATVVPQAVVDRFLRRLAPDARHELVLFDIARFTEARPLMVAEPETFTRALVADRDAPFTVTALTPEDDGTRAVREVRRLAGEPSGHSRTLGFTWPAGIFSLSHVALPIPPDDPVYGDGSARTPGRIQLGRVEARGEGGVLSVSPRSLLRLRYNPFYAYLEERVIGFVTPPPDPGPDAGSAGVRTK
jgi:alpha-beta hydrolase superfamily lysophospholipase